MRGTDLFPEWDSVKTTKANALRSQDAGKKASRRRHAKFNTDRRAFKPLVYPAQPVGSRWRGADTEEVVLLLVFVESAFADFIFSAAGSNCWRTLILTHMFEKFVI